MLPSDKTLDVDGWRTPATLKIDEATDEELAAFCTGKQVEVDMPATWRPHLPPGYKMDGARARAGEAARPGQDAGCGGRVYEVHVGRDPPHGGLSG